MLKRFEPQGISNQAEKDWHHDEAPQPPHILFNLQRNHSHSVCSAQKWTGAKLQACVRWRGDGLRGYLSLLDLSMASARTQLSLLKLLLDMFSPVTATTGLWEARHWEHCSPLGLSLLLGRIRSMMHLWFCSGLAVQTARLERQ